MKTDINKISSLTSNKKIKYFYGFVFAIMVNCTTLKELVEIFEQLCKLSLSNFIGSEQFVSYYNLLDFLNKKICNSKCYWEGEEESEFRYTSG